MLRRHFNQALASSVAALGSGLSPLARSAEAYPNKPIRFVVSYGAGGSLDVIVRPLAVDLSKTLDQSLIVTNVPGASGAIGVRRVRDSALDGYTLLVGTASEVILAPSVKAAGYNASDLTAIGKVATSGLVIAARTGLGVSNLQELIAKAKAQPGLTFGVPGAGSFHHVAMESLMHSAGIDLTMVPYPSSAQVITDLLGVLHLRGERDRRAERGGDLCRKDDLRGLRDPRRRGGGHLRRRRCAAGCGASKSPAGSAGSSRHCIKGRTGRSSGCRVGGHVSRGRGRTPRASRAERRVAASPFPDAAGQSEQAERDPRFLYRKL